MTQSAAPEYPDDRFPGVLDCRSYLPRNRHSTYGMWQALQMGRTAKNMTFSFGGTSIFNEHGAPQGLLVAPRVYQGLR